MSIVYIYILIVYKIYIFAHTMRIEYYVLWPHDPE